MQTSYTSSEEQNIPNLSSKEIYILRIDSNIILHAFCVNI